jgi:type VI protein secretion system component VasA
MFKGVGVKFVYEELINRSEFSNVLNHFLSHYTPIERVHRQKLAFREEIDQFYESFIQFL